MIWDASYSIPKQVYQCSEKINIPEEGILMNEEGKSFKEAIHITCWLNKYIEQGKMNT